MPRARRGAHAARGCCEAVLTWTGAVQVWYVAVLTAALGPANAVDIPARQAFIVEMIEGKEDLINAIGSMQAGLLGDRLGAPLTAGLSTAICLAYGLFVAWRFPRMRRMA